MADDSDVDSKFLNLSQPPHDSADAPAWAQGLVGSAGLVGPPPPAYASPAGSSPSDGLIVVPEVVQSMGLDISGISGEIRSISLSGIAESIELEGSESESAATTSESILSSIMSSIAAQGDALGSAIQDGGVGYGATDTENGNSIESVGP